MRPNIDVSHAQNGRVKDFAAARGLDVSTAYQRIIDAGLKQLDAEADGSAVAWDAIAAEYELDDAEVAACQAVVAAAADGAVTKQRVLDEVYPAHPAGKSSAEWWWRSLVNETLADAGVVTVGQEAVVRVAEGQ
jgi:hypothetical protein